MKRQPADKAKRRAIKEIRATRIILEDRQGETKVSMDASTAGLAYLQFFHGERPTLTLGTEPNGNSNITFYNKGGHAALALGVSEDLGHQGMTIFDAKGRPVCFIFTAPDGIPRIKLFQVKTADSLTELWSSPTPKKRSKKT